MGAADTEMRGGVREKRKRTRRAQSGFGDGEKTTHLRVFHKAVSVKVPYKKLRPQLQQCVRCRGHQKQVERREGWHWSMKHKRALVCACVWAWLKSRGLNPYVRR